MSTAVEHDLKSETLVRLVRCGIHFPREEGRNPPTVNTLHRWREKGAQGVKLECIPLLGVWHTSVEAIQRFVEARSNVMIEPTATPISDARRESHNRATRHELASLGIGQGSRKKPKS